MTKTKAIPKKMNNDIFTQTVAEATRWRREIHQHPETAFQELQTSAFITEKLNSFGLQVHAGLAKTGVVGLLSRGKHLIGLRADIDALPLHEENTFAHHSTIDGKMHACGHDGHTAMLLGAAKIIAAASDIDASVCFIFQPAEETEGGGRVMVEDGLFEKFPVDAIFGLHNWPGLPVGQLAIKTGYMMACSDNFSIELTGKGGHAAMPHLSADVNLCAAQIVIALQSIVARRIHPAESAVVSVTSIQSNSDAWNILPERFFIKGTARAFSDHVRDSLESEINWIAAKVAEAHYVTAKVQYQRRYPPTVNDERSTVYAAQRAVSVFGAENVVQEFLPSMGAEDFAFMLHEKPGAYAWLGNGADEGGCILHSTRYDFNDEIIPLGMAYWVELCRGFSQYCSVFP